MARIAVVGGHGKVALQLHPLLVAAGHRPVALVRNDGYRAELEALGADVRLLDIENAAIDDFAEAFGDCDAVVFSAGGGSDGNIERKWSVDLGGSLKSIDAAKVVGIRRFVQVSAIKVDVPVADDASPVWRAYVDAKRQADEALRASDLDWTILRPGALTDDAGTGRVTLAAEVDRAPIPRADVAAVVVAVIDDDATIGGQWELVSGEDPITEALATATA